jgi:putative RNA 2'-phosphotransferase
MESSGKRKIRLSKRMSYILRHQPERYSLALDSRGFVPLQDVAEVLKVSVPQIREVVAVSDKRRFEISGEKIRALYGHSRPVGLQLEASKPPELLYHGTARRFLPSIRQKGLLPMGRQFVHLSLTVEQALQVGKRRDPKPMILMINAGDAHSQGVEFHLSGDVYLARAIPARFIEILDQEGR